MHVTFRDFLVDRMRCGDNFYVDPGLMHARLAVDCLAFLHTNMFQQSRVYTAERYASNYWHIHTIQPANPTQELVNWLKEIFTSVSTDSPSLFFANPLALCVSINEGTGLLRWVDKNVVSGREVPVATGNVFARRVPEKWGFFPAFPFEVLIHSLHKKRHPTNAGIEHADSELWEFFRYAAVHQCRAGVEGLQ